jgi:hypothetical protein
MNSDAGCSGGGSLLRLTDSRRLELFETGQLSDCTIRVRLSSDMPSVKVQNYFNFGITLLNNRVQKNVQICSYLMM